MAHPPCAPREARRGRPVRIVGVQLPEIPEGRHQDSYKVCGPAPGGGTDAQPVPVPRGGQRAPARPVARAPASTSSVFTLCQALHAHYESSSDMLSTALSTLLLAIVACTLLGTPVALAAACGAAFFLHPAFSLHLE